VCARYHRAFAGILKACPPRFRALANIYTERPVHHVIARAYQVRELCYRIGERIGVTPRRYARSPRGMCDTAQPVTWVAAIVGRSMRASKQRTLAEYAMTRVRQRRCGILFFDRALAGCTTGV